MVNLDCVALETRYVFAQLQASDPSKLRLGMSLVKPLISRCLELKSIIEIAHAVEGH